PLDAPALPRQRRDAARRAAAHDDARRARPHDDPRTARLGVGEPRSGGRLLAAVRAAEAARRARLAALRAAVRVALDAHRAPAEAVRGLLEQLVAPRDPGVLVVDAEALEHRVERAVVVLGGHARHA